MTSRRNFLGALPVLAGLFDARRGVAATAAPKRLLVFTHLEGHISAAWKPAGTDSNFALSMPLQPLEPFRSKLLVLSGMTNQTARDSSRMFGLDPHGTAVTGMLTGAAHEKPAANRHPSHIEAPSASLDQFLADRLRGPARLRSAEITIGPTISDVDPTITFPVGGGACVRALRTPGAVFNRLFSGAIGLGGSEAELTRLRAKRASVLDHVAKELESVTRKVGQDDAVKVDRHLQAVRELEKQIAQQPLYACSVPKQVNDPGAASDKSLIPQWFKMQLDLAAQAFACDLTRVLTFSTGQSNWSATAPFLGVTDSTLHSISHNAKSPHKWSDVGPKLMRWSYEQMAYLLNALASIPEGEGTVLDNTLVLSIAEFGDSGGHSHANVPIVLVGNGWGYLKPGRHLSFLNKPHNDVLVTVANAFGVPIKTFGRERYCEGPMTALLA